MTVGACFPVSGPEVGGEAQFEALAYLCQAAKLQELFDHGVSAALDAVPDPRAHHAKYRWIFDIAVNSGVVWFDEIDREPSGRRLSKPRLAFDDNMAACVLYAALASRHWKQQQVRSEAISSYLPGERLASLLTGLRDNIRGRPRFTMFEEAWEIVNRTSKELFGRNIVEETEIDWEYGESYRETIKEASPDSVVHRIAVDYQEMRRRLIDLLRSDPDQIVSTNRFNNSLLGRLRPMIISASGRGLLGDPPTGHSRIFGYVHPPSKSTWRKEVRWVWAWAPDKWPVDAAQDVVTVADADAWRAVASEFAPVGKLLLNGRRHRTMLGPELIFAEQRLKAEFGIDIVFEKYFEWPQDLLRPSDYLFLRGGTTAPCDFTSWELSAEEATMFTKWALLRDPVLANVILKFWEEQGSQAAAYLAFGESGRLGTSGKISAPLWELRNSVVGLRV